MELTKVISNRYIRTKSRKEKGKILDEYCANTGLKRKYAITKIREFYYKDKVPKKRGRKKKYSSYADTLLIQVWEAYDRICGERLHPYIPEAINVLNRLGYISFGKEVIDEVLEMSCSTIKRRITKHRELNDRVLISTTKPGTLLKKHLPIKTSCWDETRAGFCEIDLVAHCGGNTSGNFINTLQFVDIKTTWTERKAVMGKSQDRVFKAIKNIREILPFDLKGMDSDNGSEFINHQLYKYCEDEKIEFTRSRPYMKKDNAHIEQKNFPLVRKILGYGRFDTEQQLHLINDLYDNELRLYINFFQPTLKLQDKIRLGSKTKKIYDNAKTPYQRVIECTDIPQENKDKLTALYLTLDPIILKSEIDKKIKKIISTV
jgi:hypothetical protein